MAVLETLREAVNFVQIEQAKRFANRALPMAAAEAAAFAETSDLWEEMRLGYLRCIDAALNGDAGMGAQAALMCQRALSYSGLKMFHHYRAYRQVPAADWGALHEVYRAAEKLSVEAEPVKDFLNRDVQDTSPLIAYARAMLMGMSNPNELSQRQLTFVAYLLELWGSKLEMSREPLQEEEGVSPMTVDVAGEQAPERMGKAPAGEDIRYLDMRKLAKSLRNRVGLLRKGESPSKLALGEDCVQPSCEQLLVFLYRQWCQSKPGRKSERRRVAALAEVSRDIAGIHYYLSGRAFRQPGEQKELTQKQREEIATFGRVSTRDEDDYSESHGLVLEQWQVEDESAQGLRLTRRAGDPGGRYSHNHLMAVRPGDAKSFMLAQVRWLMAAENGDLNAGVQLLPGLPAPTAARPTGINVQQEKWIPALSLTGVAALNAPPSLVLPVGWFKPTRVIEVFVDSAVRVRLTQLIERGADFERIAYEILP
jgi:hypothetical protein